jgi:hypothetical protein
MAAGNVLHFDYSSFQYDKHFLLTCCIKMGYWLPSYFFHLIPRGPIPRIVTAFPYRSRTESVQGDDLPHRSQCQRIAAVNRGWLTSMKKMFRLGRLLATPGAVAACEASGDNPLSFISRHAAGDWGDLSLEDMLANVQATRVTRQKCWNRRARPSLTAYIYAPIRPRPVTPFRRCAKGQKVTLVDAEPTDGFFHVKTITGKEGWVGATYLAIGVPDPSGFVVARCTRI